MNTQSIQSQNSWEQFMKLSQQARSRNSGFSVNGVQSRNKTENPESVYKKATPAVPRNANFQPSVSNHKGKTVGCNFDAYA
ncbi:hypothetical protein CHISP_1863 [Chitinispirillum alkaliphilum]|nr:hypothetical protein CHISP_1863 [Chitinispirillum alkaliphilum]